MKRIKIVATFVLTLVLLQFQGALPAHAENFFFNCGGGGTYTVDQPSGVLTKSNNCKGSVRIDESVKKIGPSAFYSSLDLTDVYIPDSVLEIGAGAFRNAYDLTSVRLPNNLITIEDSTFEMSALKAITIPNTVTIWYLHPRLILKSLCQLKSIRTCQNILLEMTSTTDFYFRQFKIRLRI